MRISVWFFIGVLLLIYGALILAAGIVSPGDVVLAQLHAGIWWGALLIALGALYVYLFLPGKR